MITIVACGIRKSSLKTHCQGIVFSDLDDLKSGEKAADFLLSGQCAISLISLSSPPNKTILLTVVFPDRLFTMQIIYIVGLIYKMKEAVSPAVLLSDEPKASSTNSTCQHRFQDSPLCLTKKNTPHARCLFHPHHSGSH